MTGLPDRPDHPRDRSVSSGARTKLGFLNGHVPITAVITAAAWSPRSSDRRDAVVLSNEWSASAPTLCIEGQPVNHQWSKGIEFEEGFARLVASSPSGPRLSVFSYLRSRSELWVASSSLAHRVPRGLPEL